jgi:hypothetical protein
MKIHRMYACEYCDGEFDSELECIKHEEECYYAPDKKRCASCGNGTAVTHYECPMVRCSKRKRLHETCADWQENKG